MTEHLYHYEWVPLETTKITDSFWSAYINLVKDVVLPYQYEALQSRVQDAEPSYAVRNFKIAAGLEKGEFYGLVFQDSDVAKWIEAVGYTLISDSLPELECLADELIDIVEAAQQADGYLNTYFTIKEPDKKWTNLLDCHEMYCAGHMIEAAIAYYRGTGKTKLLDVVCRLVDHIDAHFGPEEGKCKGYDGHQEIELALVKLYGVTKNEKHLLLSKHFIEQRGAQPHYFLAEWEQRGRISHRGSTKTPNLQYNQSHLPVREQTKAVGHAVRAVYMYTAMADIAAHTNDLTMYEACKNLWVNIVNKQMYITGGIGSTRVGEAFTFDYDLPNDTVYAETCATIGLILFARRMLQIEAQSEYADVMEKALYNTLLSGIALDGKHYFYVNPLEVWPQACASNPGKLHVKPIRQKWFSTSCCPPNIARLLSSLGEYIYSSDNKSIYVHLYISSEMKRMINGIPVLIKMDTRYPEDGTIKMSISPEQATRFTLALRNPGWCKHAKVFVNGQEMSLQNHNGYLLLEKEWTSDDIVEVNLHIEPQLIQANPQVRSNAGKVAIQRGPIVYCLEEIDNPGIISSICLSAESKLLEVFDPDLLGGTIVVTGHALREESTDWKQELYRPYQVQRSRFIFKAVPYYLWGNRGVGEMAVWNRVEG